MKGMDARSNILTCPFQKHPFSFSQLCDVVVISTWRRQSRTHVCKLVSERERERESEGEADQERGGDTGRRRQRGRFDNSQVVRLHRRWESEGRPARRVSGPAPLDGGVVELRRALSPRRGGFRHGRRRLNGYLAQRVPSLSLASSFRKCLNGADLKGMSPWRTRYPLS